jgi:cytoskeletal protein CcmA (bactofilin family)
VGAADANSNQNLYIVDISDPLNMRNVGIVRTALNVGVRGIAVEGKYAYIVTDGTSGFGFRVIDLPGADLPTATIGRLSAFEILTHGDMRVGQNLSVGDGLQVGRGGIYSQGSLTVIAHGTGASLNALDVRTGSGNPILVATSSGAVGIGSGAAINARMMIFTDNAFNQTALAIKSKETTSTQNMFTITTDYNSTNNLVYRITASGATYADAPYNSAGADYAEYFPSDPQVSIAPGEAVCLDPTMTNMVKRCDREADPNIIGIRSTKPSVVGNAVAGKVLDGLGLPVPGYTLVGLIGQLDSRATTVGSGGVIKSGDPLTSSAIPGVLRKALPGESTVGVALTGLAEGEGDIRLLIARTNTSNLTDKIDAEVSAHVAALKVDDKIKASLEAVISDSAFDERITSVVTAQLTELHPLQDRVLTLEQTISNLSAQLLALSGSTFHGTSDMGQVTGDNLTLTGSVNASDLTSENTLTVGRDARIGGDLYLEGALKVGSLIIPGGATIEGDVTTGKLKAASGSQIDGTLTVAGDLLVSRNLVFQTGATISAKQLLLSGALVVRGPITIEGLATFLGDVDVKGELTVSARQAGYAQVKAGESKVVVRFDPPFKAIPVVTVAPQGRVGSEWWTDRATMTGFTIFTDKPVTADVTFSFMALSTAEPHTASGSFASAPAGTTFFPVDEHGIPVSSSAIWNACIRHEQPMDPATGQPFSCSRYTPDLYIWNHPDFPGMTFIFNDSYNPPLLVLPEGFVSQTVSSSPVENSSSSSDSSGSSLSSSSESSSSSDSSSSDSSSSESSVSSESSSSSEQSSSSDSSSSDSSSSNSSSSDSSSSDSSSSGGSSSSQ